MSDGRKNNGGHSTKGRAGRKSKEDENRIRGLCINAMEKVFGSEEKAFNYIAELAKESYPHMKMLFEYGYGKPTETRVVKKEDIPMFSEDNPKSV